MTDHSGKNMDPEAVPRDNSGAEEEPEVYSIHRDGGAWALSRRDLLRSGATSALGAAVAGIGGAKAEAKKAPAPRVGSIGVLAHEKAVDALAISPDGKVLYSSGEDGFVKLWSLPQGGLFKAIKESDSAVKAMAASPDGRLIAIGRQDGTVHTRSLPDAAIGKTMSNDSPVFALAIGTAGKFLFSSAGGKIHAWVIGDGSLSYTFPAAMGDVLAIAITPDGKSLFAGGRDKVVTVWSLPDDRLGGLSGAVKQTTFEGHSDAVRAFAVSHDGKLLCSAGEDKKILVRSLPEGFVVQTITGHTEAIEALAITPDGKWLCSAGADKDIHVWSLPQGKKLKTLKGHTAAVTSLAISNDGALLASGSADRSVRIWDLETGTHKALIDLAVNRRDVRGTQFQGSDNFGQSVTYTLPCGSPIPAGAVCVCNCVPGTIGKSNRSFDATGICSCVLVCTCNSVCTCLSVCSCVGNATTYSYHYWYPD